MPWFKAQCVFPSENGKSPVAANEALGSDGNALCSPTLVGLENVAGSKLWANYDHLIYIVLLSFYYEKFSSIWEFLRRKGDKSVFAHTMGSTTRLGGRNMRIRILILSPLAALSSLFFWLSNSLDEPSQFDCIAIRLLNFLHPPTTPWGLACART